MLAEHLLGQLVRQRLTDAGEAITESDLQAERSDLLANLDPDPDQAQRLLNELRRTRGLGQQRFEERLRTNAGLRRLIQDQVELAPAAVAQEYELVYGPRYVARVIVCDTAAQAARVIQLARSGQPFTDLAARFSLDPSADRGGLLEPISLVDATYPQAVRDTLTKIEPGAVSEPIALEDRFLILKLERKISAKQVELDDVREDLTQRVRRRVEAMLMRRLANTMLSEADVIILHPTLKKSWEKQVIGPQRAWPAP